MYKRLSLVAVLICVPGCGLLNDLFGGLGKETGSSELKRFESEAELQSYFADQISKRNSGFGSIGSRSDDFVSVLEGGAADATGGAPPPSAAPGDGGSNEITADTDAPSGFSETTTQEEGVDEADVVKTDGSYIYVIDSGTLHIAHVSPVEELAQVASVELDGYGREIYLHGGKLIAVTESYGGYHILGTGSGIGIEPVDATTAEPSGTSEGGSEGIGNDVESDVVDGREDIGVAVYERPQTIVTVIDIAAPDSPVVLSTTELDGTQTASRMIGGVLYMVLANYQSYYYDVLPLLGDPALDTTDVDVDQLLPSYHQVDDEGVETAGSMVTWENSYRPTDPDGFGVVTVVSLNVDNPAGFEAVGIVAEPGLVYSSLGALYLTDTEYNFTGNTRETTDIYKLAYVDGVATPVATGSVPGRVLNQYSMGEYAGNLRVATTIGDNFSFFAERTGPTNSVYVLSQENTSLVTVGEVEGIAPRETIQSCRFLGDRGYVVTFESIDPFFTLDLSDPTNPRIMGELKVPGFSTFITPIDEDHLLTIGQYVPEDGPTWPQAVQLSIFDVSDFSNPQQTANVILGEGIGAYSEAIWNPKAFTYYAEEGVVALPLSIYEGFFFFEEFAFEGDAAISEGAVTVDSGSGDEPVESPPDVPPPDDGADVSASVEIDGFEGLVVFSVSAEGGFTELGRISTRFEDANIYWSSFTRGVFIGNDIFAVTDNGLRGAPLADIESVPYELIFGDSPAVAEK